MASDLHINKINFDGLSKLIFNQLSIRASLIFTIVGGGALGLLLVFMSGDIYRDLALENERAALVDQIRARIIGVREHTDREASGFARLVQSDSSFKAALSSGDSLKLESRLQQMAHQSLLQEEAGFSLLEIYDTSFKPLGSFSENLNTNRTTHARCDSIFGAATNRTADQWSRALSHHCIIDKQLYYAVLLPIKNTQTLGYVYLMIDMFKKLDDIETLYTLPTRVSLFDGSVLYKSQSWPSPNSMEHVLVAEYVPNIPASQAPIKIATTKDERAFYGKLSDTRAMVMGVTAALVFIALIGALVLVEKTAISPIRELTEQLQRVRIDKNYLGRRVNVTGNAEVIELAREFNEMTTRLEELYADLERMAFTDALTQLPNRSLFQTRLEQAIAQAREDNKGFAVLIMDLDRFKDINDTLGHHLGDGLLRQVAQRLQAKLRASDTVARMGGDEFAILLPSVNAKHADMAARMLVQTLRIPFEVEGHILDIGTSIGIALCPEHGIDASVLLQRADVAMYSAKNAGIGNAFYEPHMNQHHPAQLALMGELRQAIAQEQFILYYQPKIDLNTNRVVGVEALARWRHPNGELVLPDKFIPLLEQSGLVRHLTVWVLNEALRQVHQLRRHGLLTSISVNLSVRDLQNAYLLEEFTEQLAAHQTDAEWLELEITESAVMTDAPTAVNVLTRLSRMGFKLAIDDFGTGYSSLAYLKKLPVQAVKIDKSFVMGMTRDENDAAIVHTSIDLAHNLGLKVVAEGVDDKKALARLKELGCDVAQGMYISRPLSFEELSEWLVKSSWGLGRSNGASTRIGGAQIDA